MYRVSNKFDLEARVLGAICTDKKQYFDIASTVNVEMFSDWRKDVAVHIWERMSKMNPFDVYTVKDVLPDNLKQQAYNLFSTITDNGAEFAYKLQQEYYRLEEIKSLNNAVLELEKNEIDYSEIIRVLDGEREMRITQVSGAEKQPQKYIDLAYKLRNPSKVKQGISTGLPTLDKYTGGWNPTDYNVFAARPGMGKTTLLLNFILGAIESGSTAALYSFEMSWDQIIERLACLMAGYNPDKIRQFSEAGPEREAIANNVEWLIEKPIFVYDLSMVSKKVEDLAIHARAMQQKEGLDVIFIDYLQLLDSYKNKQGSEYESVTNASNFLRDFTKKVGIPVTTLAQLNRSVEARGGDKRPGMQDLRGSGQIEQDATGLFFIYRPEYYQILEDEEGRSLKGITEIIIGKSRLAGSLIKGKTIKLKFNIDTGKYKEYDGEEELQPVFTETHAETNWARIELKENKYRDSIPF